MEERAKPFQKVHVDFGTGDGLYAYRMAQAQPQTLVLGLDSNPDQLREISGRARKNKVPNLIFAQLSLDEAPGELLNFADSLSVILPWGSLLKAVATKNTENLLAILKSGGKYKFIYGYAENTDPGLGLPPIKGNMSLLEIKAIPSTWAKKLAFSGKNRPFVKIEGVR